MSNVKKCTPKGIELEFMRVEPGHLEELYRWVRDPWVLGGGKVSEKSDFVRINEDEDDEQTACHGDYIVRGVTGFFRVYTAEEFEALFEVGPEATLAAGLEEQKAEWEAHVVRALADKKCPNTSLPLSLGGEAGPQSMSCAVCDCFGFIPRDPRIGAKT